MPATCAQITTHFSYEKKPGVLRVKNGQTANYIEILVENESFLPVNSCRQC